MIAQNGPASMNEPREGDSWPRIVQPSRPELGTSARLPSMAFGQQSGPPASSNQVRELLSLLKDAGHASFREARGPMGFTQRQGSGNFTRDEATELIDRLQMAEPGQVSEVPVGRSATEPLIRRAPTEELAAELRRRGWTVTNPRTPDQAGGSEAGPLSTH